MFGLSIEEKRNDFYKDMKPFFDNDYAKVIAETKRATILNVCDAMYSAHFYNKQDGEQLGVLISPESVKLALENETAFFQSLSALSKEELKGRMWVAGEYMFPTLNEIKSRTDANGPTADIDVEMEKNLGVRGKGKSF